MKPKAIVLLSAGLDSLTAVSIYSERYDFVKALFFDYGQQALSKEWESAQNIANHYGFEIEKISLNFLKKADSALISTKQIPLLQESQLDDKDITLASAAAVWVPNRNGIFLNIAAAYAEMLAAQVIVTGFNNEEAQTFPDNSLAFMQVAQQFFSYSTLNGVHVVGLDMSKKEILKKAIEQQAPLQYLWSCYFGGDIMCGNCEACLRLLRAVKTIDAPVPDLRITIK